MHSSFLYYTPIIADVCVKGKAQQMVDCKLFQNLFLVIGCGVMYDIRKISHLGE